MTYQPNYERRYGSRVLNKEADLCNSFSHPIMRYTLGAQRALDDAERLARSFNYDGSDSMVDYFDVRFYGNHPSVCWDLCNKEREAILEAAKTPVVVQDTEMEDYVRFCGGSL